MICAIVHQLTRNLTPEEIEKSGFDKYYVDHTLALWPQAASGAPWTSTYFQSKGDPITDLHEDLAAEQKARTTYDNILRLVKDPEVCAPIRFLREREIVHYQRFGESLRIVQDHLDSKNFYAINPEFDIRGCCDWFKTVRKMPGSGCRKMLVMAMWSFFCKTGLKRLFYDKIKIIEGPFIIAMPKKTIYIDI